MQAARARGLRFVPKSSVADSVNRERAFGRYDGVLEALEIFASLDEGIFCDGNMEPPNRGSNVFGFRRLQRRSTNRQVIDVHHRPPRRICASAKSASCSSVATLDTSSRRGGGGRERAVCHALFGHLHAPRGPSCSAPMILPLAQILANAFFV
jgi:hypothetical protein